MLIRIVHILITALLCLRVVDHKVTSLFLMIVI